jgi:hypothetical protein
MRIKQAGNPSSKGSTAMKKQTKRVKANRKQPVYWTVRTDRRKGATLPKLPASSSK